MSHRGGRSIWSRLRRITRQHILTSAFRCPIWAETICRVDQTEVTHHVTSQLTIEDEIQIRLVLHLNENETIRYTHIKEIANTNVEKGEVLVDSRGRGAFQK